MCLECKGRAYASGCALPPARPRVQKLPALPVLPKIPNIQLIQLPKASLH